ncbi:response regulator transcription factor [Pontiellaceae bacterium B12227]|nr:response regulator transcription factor [Pontiellaceae bacterium B12227]
MKLLIVEDEADLRQALAMSLDDEGYAIDTAEDGEEGLYKALNWDYDAILLDIMMPRMDGWEVLEQLRAKKNTPVLILTARGAIDDRVRGLDLGSDDFLVKPFDMDELAARLRALIRRSAGKTTTTLSFGGLELDTAKKSISVDDQPVKLTALEFSLVQYLMMHSETVVSRTDLYEHLFNEDDDSLSNVLDVHVCNARRKLGGGYIKTRRGLGYTIGA